MFGKKPKHTVPTGAIDKIAMAKRMREATRDEMQFRGGKPPTRSQTIPVAIVFAISVILSLLMTDGGSNPLSGLHPTGIYFIDHLLTGTDIPPLTGDADMDRLAAILLRGGAFFLMTGFIPFLAFVAVRMSGKGGLSPLVACWGAGILCMLVFMFLPLGDLVHMITSLFGHG
jgi:hypothetical protein